jgi:hypothetical protein
MSPKYCSGCIQKLPPSCFLKDTLASPTSRVYASCIQCRAKSKASSKKRATLQSLDPNIQPTKRVCRSKTRPQPTVLAPLPLNPPIEAPHPPLNPLVEPLLPQAPVTDRPPTEPTGFLPTDEWQRIRDFNQAMEDIQMETCQRCQEHGFSMVSATGAFYGIQTTGDGL